MSMYVCVCKSNRLQTYIFLLSIYFIDSAITFVHCTYVQVFVCAYLCVK